MASIRFFEGSNSMVCCRRSLHWLFCACWDNPCSGLEAVNTLPARPCPPLHPFLIGAIGNVVPLLGDDGAGHSFPPITGEKLVGLTWWTRRDRSGYDRGP